jgi:hypothetical protein
MFYPFFATQIIEADPVAIKQPFKPISSYCDRFSKEYQFEELIDDNSLSYAQQARSKVLRSSELGTLNFPNNAHKVELHRCLVFVLVASLGLISRV